MRVWSLHPSYLDSKGLVALWRETLLAQHVLSGKTKGYRNHPQLNRFKEHDDPVGAIASYLEEVFKEAQRRDYHFDQTKILPIHGKIAKIKVTQEQMDYEFAHLCRKLEIRDPQKLIEVRKLKAVLAHPLFKVIDGDIADWEKRSEG